MGEARVVNFSQRVPGFRINSPTSINLFAKKCLENWVFRMMLCQSLLSSETFPRK